jgi:acylphosphatase
MSDAIRQVTIRGRVQGVGYRYWLEQQARARGLEGWVRNRRNGSVEALLAGPPDVVSGMIASCRRGPSSARVDALGAIRQCRCAKTTTARRAIFGAADDLARSPAPGGLRRSLTVMIAANPIIAAAIIMRHFGIEAPRPRSGDKEQQEDKTIEDCGIAAVDQREEAL